METKNIDSLATCIDDIPEVNGELEDFDDVCSGQDLLDNLEDVSVQV